MLPMYYKRLQRSCRFPQSHNRAPPIGLGDRSLPWGQIKEIILDHRLALAGVFIQTNHCNQALLDRIRALGVKLVLPHTIHNAQVGHELYVGFCPVRNHPAVGIGQ